MQASESTSPAEQLSKWRHFRHLSEKSKPRDYFLNVAIAEFLSATRKAWRRQPVSISSKSPTGDSASSSTGASKKQFNPFLRLATTTNVANDSTSQAVSPRVSVSPLATAAFSADSDSSAVSSNRIQTDGIPTRTDPPSNPLIIPGIQIPSNPSSSSSPSLSSVSLSPASTANATYRLQLALERLELRVNGYSSSPPSLAASSPVSSHSHSDSQSASSSSLSVPPSQLESEIAAELTANHAEVVSKLLDLLHASVFAVVAKSLHLKSSPSSLCSTTSTAYLEQYDDPDDDPSVFSSLPIIPPASTTRGEFFAGRLAFPSLSDARQIFCTLLRIFASLVQHHTPLNEYLSHDKTLFQKFMVVVNFIQVNEFKMQVNELILLFRVLDKLVFAKVLAEPNLSSSSIHPSRQAIDLAYFIEQSVSDMMLGFYDENLTKLSLSSSSTLASSSSSPSSSSASSIPSLPHQPPQSPISATLSFSHHDPLHPHHLTDDALQQLDLMGALASLCRSIGDASPSFADLVLNGSAASLIKNDSSQGIPDDSESKISDQSIASSTSDTLSSSSPSSSSSSSSIPSTSLLSVVISPLFILTYLPSHALIALDSMNEQNPMGLSSSSSSLSLLSQSHSQVDFTLEPLKSFQQLLHNFHLSLHFFASLVRSTSSSSSSSSSSILSSSFLQQLFSSSNISNIFDACLRIQMHISSPSSLCLADLHIAQRFLSAMSASTSESKSSPLLVLLQASVEKINSIMQQLCELTTLTVLPSSPKSVDSVVSDQGISMNDIITHVSESSDSSISSLNPLKQRQFQEFIAAKSSLFHSLALELQKGVLMLTDLSPESFVSLARSDIDKFSAWLDQGISSVASFLNNTIPIFPWLAELNSVHACLCVNASLKWMNALLRMKMETERTTLMMTTKQKNEETVDVPRDCVLLHHEPLVQKVVHCASIANSLFRLTSPIASHNSSPVRILLSRASIEACQLLCTCIPFLRSCEDAASAPPPSSSSSSSATSPSSVLLPDSSSSSASSCSSPSVQSVLLTISSSIQRLSASFNAGTHTSSLVSAISDEFLPNSDSNFVSILSSSIPPSHLQKVRSSKLFQAVTSFSRSFASERAVSSTSSSSLSPKNSPNQKSSSTSIIDSQSTTMVLNFNSKIPRELSIVGLKLMHLIAHHRHSSSLSSLPSSVTFDNDYRLIETAFNFVPPLPSALHDPELHARLMMCLDLISLTSLHVSRLTNHQLTMLVTMAEVLEKYFENLLVKRKQHASLMNSTSTAHELSPSSKHADHSELNKEIAAREVNVPTSIIRRYSSSSMFKSDSHDPHFHHSNQHPSQSSSHSGCLISSTPPKVSKSASMRFKLSAIEMYLLKLEKLLTLISKHLGSNETDLNSSSSEGQRNDFIIHRASVPQSSSVAASHTPTSNVPEKSSQLDEDIGNSSDDHEDSNVAPEDAFEPTQRHQLRLRLTSLANSLCNSRLQRLSAVASTSERTMLQLGSADIIASSTQMLLSAKRNTDEKHASSWSCCIVM